MKERMRWLLLLQVFLCIYAFGSVLSKWATSSGFSLKFILLYGGMLLCMMIYAVGWQQAIKRLPLTTAYANKAVTVVWGVVFGLIFFGEQLTIAKLIGMIVIICGVLLFVKADTEDAHE